MQNMEENRGGSRGGGGDLGGLNTPPPFCGTPKPPKEGGNVEYTTF